MATTFNPHDEWRHVATIEVAEGPAVLQKLLEDRRARCRIERRNVAPSGFAWFDIYIDFSIGSAQAAHEAYAVLSTFGKAADDGVLHAYRIVNGRHWLQLAQALGIDDGIID